MATNLTRFEIVLPMQTDTNRATIQQFLTNLASLTNYVLTSGYIVDNTGTFTNHDIIYGLLTAAQQSTALGYLNTLNAALGQNVLCTVNTVTSEP